jgi:hypothetical protein
VSGSPEERAVRSSSKLVALPEARALPAPHKDEPNNVVEGVRCDPRGPVKSPSSEGWQDRVFP